MGLEFTLFQPAFGAEESYIYILTAVLFLFSIISFIKSNFDILNPSFIYSVCFTGCCLLTALYTKIWNLPMHFNTSFIIIGMSSIFLLGGILAEYQCSYTPLIPIKENCNFQDFSINPYIWIISICILLYCLYLNYIEFLNLANQVTNETELKNMLGPVVSGFAHQQIEASRWSGYRIRLATGMAYLSILAIWLNYAAHNYREAIKWSSFVFLYVPFIVLTGGRQPFMYLILFSISSFFLVLRKKNNNECLLKKECAVVSISIIIFLACFLGIGLINGKINVGNDFVGVLAHYSGINISAFDVYINEMIIPDTLYIGSTTLDPIYSFLYNHGFNVPKFSIYNTLFTIFGPVETNVYTALYRYIHDFGYLGCAIVMFLLGYFYSCLYRKLYQHGLKNSMILVYSSIAYPIFLMGREERFFNEILTTSNFSFIIELLLLYKFFEFLNQRRD